MLIDALPCCMVMTIYIRLQYSHYILDMDIGHGYLDMDIVGY